MTTLTMCLMNLEFQKLRTSIQNVHNIIIICALKVIHVFRTRGVAQVIEHALQVQSPEFKPKSHQKLKSMFSKMVLNMYFYTIFFLFFETVSPIVAKAGFKLTVLLSQPPKGWHYRHEPSSSPLSHLQPLLSSLLLILLSFYQD
jgi:hypothetical protein